MIRVVGTVVMDLLSRVDRIPVAGETVLGKGGLRLRLGGKGFNQAIFAAQHAARVSNGNGRVDVAFHACVGNDQFGAMAKQILLANQIESHLQISSKESTGTGSICLEEGTGENSIVVSLGANRELDLEANGVVFEVVAAAERRGAMQITLGQLELPLNTTLVAFRQGNAVNILNAAPIPAQRSDAFDELLQCTDILVVNQVEAEMLAAREKGSGSGGASLVDVARHVLHTRLHAGALAVIVTLGRRGALFVKRDGTHAQIPGTAHVAVDAVGAGDCFMGTLAVEMLRQTRSAAGAGGLLAVDLQPCILAANQAAGEYVSRQKPDYSLGELL